jgi:hypothetical protein
LLEPLPDAVPARRYNMMRLIHDQIATLLD